MKLVQKIGVEGKTERLYTFRPAMSGTLFTHGFVEDGFDINMKAKSKSKSADTIL